jgi:hypothetical protein
MSDEIIPWQVDMTITNLQDEVDIREAVILRLNNELALRDDFISRLLETMIDMVGVGPGYPLSEFTKQDVDPAILALLEEGKPWYRHPIGYIVRRQDGVEYGPFGRRSEADAWMGTGKTLITIWSKEEANDSRTPSSPTGSD